MDNTAARGAACYGRICFADRYYTEAAGREMGHDFVIFIGYPSLFYHAGQVRPGL